MNIKKWLVIGLSSTAIIIWVLFFMILIGRDAPELTAKQHTTAVREEVALSSQTNRFNQVDQPKSEQTDMLDESMDFEENREDQLAKSTAIDQEILYDFETGNGVSIDALLAALNIGEE
ncbi:hypothetical protein [Paraliobacillus sediminis]|uniref:hypothetical protein n=1 Tax=Paraliobacillus sediminis TaxID=1885916 RepID=UPI000E3BF184|nr:hypothetical protein [Paraliobacillus sediminis]